jgi:hypothetical protein
MPTFRAREEQDCKRLLTESPLSSPVPSAVGTGSQQYVGRSDAADSAELDYASAGGSDSGSSCVSWRRGRRLLQSRSYQGAELYKTFPYGPLGDWAERERTCAVRIFFGDHTYRTLEVASGAVG